MNTQKKLKRGLKELSPLFRKNKKGASSALATAPAPGEIFKPAVAFDEACGRPQFVSVFSCDDMGGDSLLLGSYLASKLTEKGKSCLVLSVTDDARAKPKEIKSLRGPVKNVTLDWNILREVWQNPTDFKAQPGNGFDPVTFVDFDITNVPQPQKLVSVLDKCILLVQPTFESLRECYRMLKMTLTFNPTLEYFMIYDGPASDGRGTVIFERLSEMITKRLGADLVWLGCLEKMKRGAGAAQDLALEHLFFKSADKDAESVEKKALEALLVQTCLEISRGGGK